MDVFGYVSFRNFACSLFHSYENLATSSLQTTVIDKGQSRWWHGKRPGCSVAAGGHITNKP